MDMVWHDRIFYQFQMPKMVFHILQIIFRNFTENIQLSRITKETSHFMGTNGNKIVMITGIIKIRDSCRFSAVKLRHTDASLKGSGRVKTLPYKLRFELFPFRNRQFVAAVVHGIIRMALDPMVVQFMGLGQAQQHFPKVGI